MQAVWYLPGVEFQTVFSLIHYPAPSINLRRYTHLGPLVSRRVTQAGRGIRRGLSERAVVPCVFSFCARVPQPPGSSSNTGRPRQWRLTRGVFFFGDFLLDKQKKVTSTGAAPPEI